MKKRWPWIQRRRKWGMEEVVEEVREEERGVVLSRQLLEVD